MKASRQTNRVHWIGVGRRARACALDIEAVLTKNEGVNAWIRQGYGTATRYPRSSGVVWYPTDQELSLEDPS